MIRRAPIIDFELSPIKAMELEAAKRPGSISLAQGIPSFDTPPVIRNFIADKVREGACDKYSLTIGLEELREEIAESLRGESLSFDPNDEIIVTAGSIEGITASVLSVTEPGDEVLIPSPTYASYLGSIFLARCVPKYVSLDEDKNFDFDIERFKSAITRKTKAILYCSPNNPTGTVYSEDKTKELIKIAIDNNIKVICDEVYKDFYYTNDTHFSSISIEDARKHIIRVCSFSKAYAMTGWRVGFLHADKSLVKNITKYHDAMVTCAPVASQYGAIAALRYGAPFLKEFRDEFRRRRDRMIEGLDSLSEVFDYQLPKATYFVFPRVKDSIPLARDSRALALDILDKVKLAVVPGIAFGPAGEAHIRMSYGKEMDVLDEAISRLHDYFQASHTRSTSKAKSMIVDPIPTPLTTKFLLKAASFYLKRTKPITIAIAGLRGKTIFKRKILELFENKHPARGSILSHNTLIGMPLSVLGLDLPSSYLALCLFPIKVIYKSLFAPKDADILVLELGIGSRNDAKEFLEVLMPDWLILTQIDSFDPSLRSDEKVDGILDYVKAVPPRKILWHCSKESLAARGIELDPELSLSNDVSNSNSSVATSSAGAFQAELILERLLLSSQTDYRTASQ